MPLTPSTEQAESPKLSDVEQGIHNAFLALRNDPTMRDLVRSPPLPPEQRSSKPYSAEALSQELIDNLNRNTAEKG